ncbi:MAG TPA: extracellular solute-binding protein [Termitinemataceae bacterium]|uniref:extracellular solute-binding protein n=1 Tax=Treponema sp. J25 TaxID=2094121 RepID=UPI00104A1BC5|nr:extracellular solute-binding protein [Treponema sp. J25]TCW62302.1 ABC transporter substrate-binding protein [Treponema sp. J25]HOJ99347.1 extracellular solute-binding protein [Termitinemataceae bacterium]HOM22512.1 extracellular solute-binding protein [Termitinemataceae bacterium]HPQ00717.1 extracellular solute-binding protein [Termitinemataceae bacterium]
MKRFVSMVLVLLLAFGMVTFTFAEGQADGKGGSSSGPVTIELWYGAAVTEAGPPPADWVALKIIKEKLNIDLKITALPSANEDQDVKINTAAAANALPDLFMVSRPVWMNLIKQGLIAPVDDLYPLMPNRCKYHYDEDSRAFTTVNGKSYGLASPGSIAKNEGLLIRKDWLDKLGLKVPTTTEELFQVMKAFTTKDPDGNGKDDTYGFGAFIEINNFEEGLGRRFDPIFGAFGVAGTWNLSAKNPGLNVRKPEYYDALAYVRRMVDEKVIDPNWVSYKKDDFRAAWKQGRFGIMREQNAAYAAESNYTPFDKNFPNGEWIVIDPPKGPKGFQSVGVFTQSYRIYAVSTKAMKAGKGPAIAKLLEWMSSDEGYFLLGWGVEGVNYVKGPDGVPTVNGIPDPAKGFSKPEMQPLTQLRNMVFYNGDLELKARYPTYKAPYSGKTMSALTVLRDMQKRPWTNGVGADTLPNPSADLKRFYEQGVVEFVTGARQLTPENWKAWVAEFDKMGGLDWEKAGIEYARANNLLK